MLEPENKTKNASPKLRANDGETCTARASLFSSCPRQIRSLRTSLLSLTTPTTAKDSRQIFDHGQPKRQATSMSFWLVGRPAYRDCRPCGYRKKTINAAGFWRNPCLARLSAHVRGKINKKDVCMSMKWETFFDKRNVSSNGFLLFGFFPVETNETGHVRRSHGHVSYRVRGNPSHQRFERRISFMVSKSARHVSRM